MIRVLSWLLGLSLLLGLALAPRWTVDHPYVLHMLVLMCIYAIPAVGLNLMLGYSGLVSLGHMGFAGLGAYTAAVLMVDVRWSFWSALGAATLASAVAGALIGLICFRFRGHFFMIVTLAFGLLLHAVKGFANYAPHPGACLPIAMHGDSASAVRTLAIINWGPAPEHDCCRPAAPWPALPPTAPATEQFVWQAPQIRLLHAWRCAGQQPS